MTESGESCGMMPIWKLLKLPDTGAVQLTVIESDVAFTFCRAATDSGSEKKNQFFISY